MIFLFHLEMHSCLNSFPNLSYCTLLVMFIRILLWCLFLAFLLLDIYLSIAFDILDYTFFSFEFNFCFFFSVLTKEMVAVLVYFKHIYFPGCLFFLGFCQMNIFKSIHFLVLKITTDTFIIIIKSNWWVLFFMHVRSLQK